MARFALLLPREEMVEPAGRIARELEMDVVLNQSVPTGPAAWSPIWSGRRSAW